MDSQHWQTGDQSQSTGSAPRADTATPASPQLPPPPEPPASPADALADWPPPVQPSGESGGGRVTIRLWSARDVGLISFLLGFPAGLGLAAVNWYRLGRRPLAYAHLLAGVIALLVIGLWTDASTGLSAALNVGFAVYLYVQVKAALERATRDGVSIAGGGVGAGLATVLGSWVLMLALVGATAGVLGAAGAIGNVPPAAVSTSPLPAATTGPQAATAPGSAGPASGSPSGTDSDAGSNLGSDPDLSACDTPDAMPHQAPDLEAQLPRQVGGRDLSTWSVAGWCWLRMAVGEDGLAEIAPILRAESIDVGNLQYAIAGRLDTQADPPYFVFAAYRPQANAEIDVALGLLLQGAGYRNGVTVDLSQFEPRELGDRVAFVGTTDMVTQSEHQRGRPWLYQTDSAMFLVITDDDAWAEDAIRQLPCCWAGG